MRAKAGHAQVDGLVVGNVNHTIVIQQMEVS